MIANRVCNHGIKPSAAPTAIHRRVLTRSSISGSAANNTSVAPSPSGYTANAWKKNGTVSAPAAHANHAAAALPVSTNDARHNSALPAAAINERNATTPG